MIGLTYIVVFWLLYWLTKQAVRSARSQGRPGWHGGLPVGLLLFGPLFWELIPTHALHQYRCATESGYWVYKTSDQWKQENPGIAETLVAPKAGTPRDENDAYVLNQRFRWKVDRGEVGSFLPVGREEQTVYDVATGEVMARYVDFRSGYGNPFAAPDPKHGLSAFKFWLGNGHCFGGRGNYDRVGNLAVRFKHLREKK